MELVDGEMLAERISRGAIPLDEALPLAKQIAEALEAAADRRDTSLEPMGSHRMPDRHSSL
jgi:hypothetical protein